MSDDLDFHDFTLHGGPVGLSGSGSWLSGAVSLGRHCGGQFEIYRESEYLDAVVLGGRMFGELKGLWRLGRREEISAPEGLRKRKERV